MQFSSLHDSRFVCHGNPGVYVEHMRPGRYLGDGVLDDALVVAGGHFPRQRFAPGGVDAFADDGKRPFCKT